MKRFLSGLSMAFSMFTVFPLPCRWDDGARRMQLACLPVVGLFIGVVWAAACYGCFSLRLPALLSGALIAALINMRMRRAIPSIFLGVIAAGIIVTLVMQLGITALNFLVG